MKSYGSIWRGWEGDGLHRTCTKHCPASIPLTEHLW